MMNETGSIRQTTTGSRRYALLLVSFVLLSYILPLGVRPLMVPDETRYGEIPREMIASGDWAVPHIDGIRYFEKPVLGYWVHAFSLLLFGQNNFGVRLPSALSVALSALLVFLLVYRARGNDGDKDGYAAAIAALVLLSCFEVFGVGTFAVLDSLFSFLLTATIAFFFLASEAPRGSGRERLLLLLTGVSCGAAFLTKGFLALAVPVLVLAPYLVWQRRYSDLARMSWLPILTGVLVALPWGVWIHLREPDFWHFFVWNEHIRRFMGDNAQHKQSVWFFLLAAPGLFFPWTLLVPAAAMGIRERAGERNPQGRLIKLSLCWAALPFLFFSLSHGKLLTYILPCFPPFAILMTFGLLRVLDKNGRDRLVRWGIAATAAFLALFLFVFVYLQIFGYDGFRLYSSSFKAALVAGGFVCFVSLCVWAYKMKKASDKLLVFGMAPLLSFCIAPFAMPDSTNTAKSPGPLLERNKSHIGDTDVIISDGETIGAACWYLRRSDVYVLEGAGELDYGFTYEDAAGREIDVESAIDLIHRNPGKVVLIQRSKRHPQWPDRFPKPVFEDNSGRDGYALWKY